MADVPLAGTVYTVASPLTMTCVTVNGSPSGSVSATSPTVPVSTLPETGVSSSVVRVSLLATGGGLVTVYVKFWLTAAPLGSVAVTVTV